jgi:hypothetical protein
VFSATWFLIIVLIFYYTHSVSILLANPFHSLTRFTSYYAWCPFLLNNLIKDSWLFYPDHPVRSVH